MDRWDMGDSWGSEATLYETVRVIRDIHLSYLHKFHNVQHKEWTLKYTVVFTISLVLTNIPQ